MRFFSFSAAALLLVTAACKPETTQPAAPFEEKEQAVKPTEAAPPPEGATNPSADAKEPAGAKAPTEAVPAEGTTAEAGSVPGKTGVVGLISFEGKAPAPRAIDMSKDAACTKNNKNPTVKDVDVTDGKLKNVFVYVKSGLPAGAKFPPRAEVVSMDQKGCLYEPTVLGIQVGQPFEVVNSDPLLHNVHAFAGGAGEFNQAMPKQGQKITKKFKKAQVGVPVKCEVHPWMQAWVGVVDHPFFAVSDASGAFAIEGLPAGTYEVELHHPTLGAQTQSVTVKDGAATSVKATFKAS